MDENTQAVVRHLLSMLGGVLVTSGAITGAQEQDAIGAIMVLATIGWSLYNKYRHKQALTAAKSGAHDA